jgi:hypothetical protein
LTKIVFLKYSDFSENFSVWRIFVDRIKSLFVGLTVFRGPTQHPENTSLRLG